MVTIFVGFMASGCSFKLYKPEPIKYSKNETLKHELREIQTFVDVEHISYSQNHHENIEISKKDVFGSFSKSSKHFPFRVYVSELTALPNDSIGEAKFYTQIESSFVLVIKSMVVEQKYRERITITEYKGASASVKEYYKEEDSGIEFNDRLQIELEFELIDVNLNRIVKSGIVSDKSTINEFLDIDELNYGFESVFRKLLWNISR